MAVPFVAFWVLLFLCREELGIKGIGIAIVVWTALLIGFLATGIQPVLFVTAQAIIDIVLVLKVFGGDVKLS